MDLFDLIKFHKDEADEAEAKYIVNYANSDITSQLLCKAMLAKVEFHINAVKLLQGLQNDRFNNI